MLWVSRLEYKPENALAEVAAQEIVQVSSKAPTNLAVACTRVSQSQDWMLLVLRTAVVGDSEARRFFETASDSYGMFVDYNEGRLRIGLGLGPELDTQFVPLRLVRYAEDFVVFIGITNREIRAVANTLDESILIPDSFMSTLNCESFKVVQGSSNRLAGTACKVCKTSVSYLTGNDEAQLDKILDAASNMKRFRRFGVGGTALGSLGALLMFLPRRAINRRDVPSDSGRPDSKD